MKMMLRVMVVMAGVACGAAGAWAQAAAPAAGVTPAVAPAMTPAMKQELLEKPLAVLQQALAGTDPALRANALEALQPLRDPRVVDDLRKGLGDREWIVRFAAAMAAGKRKQADLQPVLTDLLRTEKNDNVRVALVYALKRLGDDSHMDLLATTLAAPDPSVRANTALVLGMLGDKSAIGLLKTRTGETDIRVRLELTAALARLGDPVAVQAILGQSVSLYAEDHYVAIATCPDIHAPEVNNVLLQGLKDNTPDGPLIAAKALGKVGSDQGVPIALATLAKENATPQQRALAALALGEVLPPRDAMPVEKLLNDSDPHVALAAAAGLIDIYSRAMGTALTAGN